MSKTLFTSAVLMIFAGAIATGCSSDCESICEDGKDCDGASTKGIDCAEQCETNEKNNETAGCSDQYDNLTSCISDNDKVCSSVADSGCTPEFEAYQNCAVKYCTSHPDSSICR